VANSYDTAVVGMGLVGAAALRHLSATGRHCVGIGPTEPLDWSTHNGVFASHYDSGRVTRRLDKRREWAVLAARAIDAYPDIETRSGIRFHHPVGVVMADVDTERLSAVVAVGHALGVDFHAYQAGEPFEDDRISVPTGSMVLREPSPGGFIDPRRMLAGQLTICRHHGATVVGEEVKGIEQSGNGWSVHMVDGSSIEAEHVVIAAGPHADEVVGLPRTPFIDVVAETVVMARVSTEEQLRLAGLPSIIIDGPEDHLYIVPPTEYPDGHVYVKLGATRHDQWILAADERREWMTGTFHAADLDWLHGLLVGALPGLHSEGWSTKPCLIPDTPTKLPYLEIVEPGLVMAVGSNGYAAKSADAIGALAAGLVVNERWTDPELDEQSFKLISRN
jgi:sarcosine oxidase